jgi:hypothetical protein
MNPKTAHMSLRELMVAQTSRPYWSIRLLVAIVLVLWFALVFVLGAKGAFVQSPGTPPFPILFGATIPLILFLGAYFTSAGFKAFVLASDLRLGAAIQGWRVAGLGFLALYAQGILPGLFALPAGLGDIAIGATAPWIVLALARRPAFAASRVFVIWNILGILDLLNAMSTGALSSGFLAGFAGNVTTAPMAQLPLVLIPAYLVPLFVMLHLAALFQVSVPVRKDQARP